MEHRDDGLLDGIEDELANELPAGLIATVLLFDAALLAAAVLLLFARP